MKYLRLSNALSIKTVSEKDNEGVFEIEGLYPGYGLTMANAFRRALLSSLPGAAITQFKIKGVGHEFTTIPGVLEDVIEIGLNLKKVRFVIHVSEPQTVALKIKGEKTVTAKDIKTNAQLEIVNADAHIATLTAKNAELEMEIIVEKGLGYATAESRKTEKLPIGTIAIDALFSPVTNVSHTIENMRIGETTNYNKLIIKITTDGTISPTSAFHKTSNILRDHFEKIGKVGDGTDGKSKDEDMEGEDKEDKK